MKALAGMLLVVVLCGPAQAGAAATAKMIDTSGHTVGRANLKAAPHGILIEIEVNGLSPGPHAVLLHGAGSCEPSTGFASAGEVFTLDAGRKHGYFAKGGPRAGDLPNQFADAGGTLHATFFTTALSLGNGKKSIIGPGGISIVVHAKADDYVTQPEGRSGARVACGAVVRTVAPGRGRNK
jgi:superoxide dismutase, Cu-Zn family